jgi:RNA polymerase sigma-70 factor (ECF subfamily)
MAHVADGNLDSLRFLFDRYHRRIFNFILQMCGDRELSNDLTQDVFYKVMKYRTSYKGGQFASWIFTITRNGVHTHFRKHKTRMEDLETVLYKIEDEEDSNGKEDHAFLKYALQQLDIEDREILIMHKMQGIKYEELGNILEITPGAAKAKAYRALKKLRTIYFQKS